MPSLPELAALVTSLLPSDAPIGGQISLVPEFELSLGSVTFNS